MSSASGLEELQTLQQQSEQPILVKFVAPHCPACETLAPLLEQLVTEQAGKLALVAIDLTEEPELAMSLGVRSAPTVVAFRGTTVIECLAGLKPKKQYSELVNALAV